MPWKKHATHLNCLFVALYLWWKSKGKWLFGVRRSNSLRGTIPHFVISVEREQGCSLIDYVPVVRKQHIVDKQSDSILFFKGQYVIRRYQLIETIQTDSLEEMMKHLSNGELK